MKEILGKKIGMTRIFDRDGRNGSGDGDRSRSVSGGGEIDSRQDGYDAYQVGFGGTSAPN